jgi:hypothetical protein
MAASSARYELGRAAQKSLLRTWTLGLVLILPAALAKGGVLICRIVGLSSNSVCSLQRLCSVSYLAIKSHNNKTRNLKDGDAYGRLGFLIYCCVSVSGRD